MMFFLLLFVSFVTSPATTKYAEDRVFPCSSSITGSSLSVFRCHNRTECIDVKHLCDGIRDCADASDEVNCSYPERNYSHSEDETFRRIKRQSNCGRSGLCILPKYPAYGTYKVPGMPKARPGRGCDSVVLSVTCNPGYGVLAPDGGISNSLKLLCVDGEWSPGLIPQCVRYCELIPDASVRYTCRYPGSQLFRPCGRHVSHGTTVNPHCNGPVYYSHKSLLYMHCRHGSWDYVATCEPDCGRVTPEGVGLISNGKTAKRGELPWHVGVYSKISSPYSQICGGTLVSNNVVISAAHCFWNDGQKQLPASMFAVAAGKLYRSWKNIIDFESQESDVQEILIPERFQGTGSNLQADVAALILSTPFEYKIHVKPVCLSFTRDFDSLQLQAGQMGKIAGWGLTSANGAVSEELKVVELPYVEYSRCYNTVPHSFHQFLTLDKFCAGYTDGTAVCQGDSGGGLSFPTPDQHTQRYYLRGVVSAAPTLTDKRCNDQDYATFTRVAEYGEFIKEALQVRTFVSEPVSPDIGCFPDQFQCNDGTCVNGEDECFKVLSCVTGFEESCAPEVPTTSFPVQEEPFPLHRETNVSLQQPVKIDKEEKSFCTLPTNTSIIYECQVPATDEYLPCSGVIPLRTYVSAKCSTFSSSAKYIKCTSGNWEHISGTLRCQNEDHRELVQITPGTWKADNVDTERIFRSKRENLPWHVGIYDNVDLAVLCGGTIFSKNAVLTALTCYTDLPIRSPSSLTVTSGQQYRYVSDHRNTAMRVTKVKEVMTPPQDPSSNIAVLVLMENLIYNMYIHPVALNFDGNIETAQDQADQGKLASWTAGQVELMSINLPYIRTQNCSNIDLREATGNTCTGYFGPMHGVSILEGSSIVYKGINNYNLKAIITNVRSCDTCAENSTGFVILTTIGKHEEFLKRFINKDEQEFGYDRAFELPGLSGYPTPANMLVPV